MRALVGAGLRHYWRSHLAVVVGVATAAAVLGGSLVVGDSVRASLRRTALERLGRTETVVAAPRPFREAAVGGGAPLLALRGSVARQDGSRRAGNVHVYGVDPRFFAFHGLPAPDLSGRAAWLSPALAEEMASAGGDPLVVLAEVPPDIPGSLLFGRRDEPARRLRVSAAGVLPRAAGGEFALQPSSDATRAVFVPLALLQRTLDLAGRVNTVLHAGEAPSVAGFALEDVGLRLRERPERGFALLESAQAVLDDAIVTRATRAARGAGATVEPLLVYVATTLAASGREVPYSLVLARPDVPEGTVALNAWAAQQLGVVPGATVELAYDTWREEGRIEAGRTGFRLDRVVAMEDDAADPALVPPYPGITDSAHLADWDPPFPVDLSRIRPADEAYWERWRTAPKAFVSLEDGQRLWGHRLGRVTSLRLRGGDPAALRTTLTRDLVGDRGLLAAQGVVVQDVRGPALLGARGSTDFGLYFVSFSFFIAVSALLLAGLFFKLNLEQRLREVGLLKAVGYEVPHLRRLFAGEAAVVAGAGALLGLLGALGFARLVLVGLRRFATGVVGSQELVLEPSALSLAVGAAAAFAVSLLVVVASVRGLGRRTARTLLAGEPAAWGSGGAASTRWMVLVAIAAVLSAAAGGLGWLPAPAAFFALGGLLLVGGLLVVAHLLRRPRGVAQSLSALGFRGAAFRPARSVVSVALVAFAAFVIVSVGAFRQPGPRDLRDRAGESGGYTLLASSTRPLHHDPRTAEGGAALSLPGPVALARFRRADGEDASCLNLYRPTRPTVLGAEPGFLREGRFSFAASLAETAAERANPWLLAERPDADGIVPVIADATTLQYVLHRKLGEVMPLGDRRVRFVGALRPGVLQGALLTGEAWFQQMYPREEGYRTFLLEAPPGGEEALTRELESALADVGFDVTPAAARLEALHRVENTYIATFQALGALGLLLGTLGVAAVLLRNGLERRRELALLRAVGYRPPHLRRMLVGETVLVLGAGLAVGVAPALLAILPALRDRPAAVPLLTVAGLVVVLLAVGSMVSLAAARWLERLPLLPSLRSE